MQREVVTQTSAIAVHHLLIPTAWELLQNYHYNHLNWFFSSSFRWEDALIFLYLFLSEQLVLGGTISLPQTSSLLSCCVFALFFISQDLPSYSIHDFAPLPSFLSSISNSCVAVSTQVCRGTSRNQTIWHLWQPDITYFIERKCKSYFNKVINVTLPHQENIITYLVILRLQNVW